MFDVTESTVKSILASMGMSDLSLPAFIAIIAVLAIIAAVRAGFVVTRESRRQRRATLAALESNAMISNAITGTND
jgi:hypothetical protein